GLAGTGQGIELYGPEGLKDYLSACCKFSSTHLGRRLTVHTIREDGLIYEDQDFQVSCGLLKHRIPAYGYRVAEKQRPGRFNVEQAQVLGIPSGPLYGQLKQGKTVTLADGRTIRGQDLCEPPEPGRTFVYCTDTVFCEGAIALAQGADLLVHEATFAHQDAQMAFDRLHSTSTMAAQVALLAQVKQLIMTHFSPRYAPGNVLQLDNLLAEAQAIFPNTRLARDFLTVEIPRLREQARETVSA
ncbi:MAG: MBL fold metallo-hydrolase, partial [Synechocystis sp.]